MPRYPEGFTAEEYDELRAVVTEVGEEGPFDANALLFTYIERRAAAEGGTVEDYNRNPVNAGSVAQVLDDLCDLGVLRSLGGDPPRWELAGTEE
jgi:hypothetical protein